MKRMVLLAIALIGMTAVGVAQESATLPTTGDNHITMPKLPIILPHAPVQLPSSVSSSVEGKYTWYSRHFERIGPDSQGQDADSNIWNWFVPTTIRFNNSPAEQRGVGQIIAPGMYWDWFKTLGNNPTNLYSPILEVDSFPTPQDYYKQFQNAQGFTIDALIAFLFKNPNITPTTGAKFVVFSTPSGVNMKTYFNGANYQQGGFFAGRHTSLVEKNVTELTPEDIDGTVANNTIQPLVFTYDPPLFFDNNTAAVAMFINEDAPSVDPTNIVQGNTEEYEVMRSFWEYRTGDPLKKGTSPGIPPYKALGAIMLRQGTSDTVFGLNALTYTFGQLPDTVQVRTAQDMYMIVLGSVDILSGVKYHFGREATSQGLGDVVPNPVVANARLPFSLTELADVTIDLFDVSGQLVKNLVDAHRWVPGNYSVDLHADQLGNGTYLVRMTANGKPYSMKFTVAR